MNMLLKLLAVLLLADLVRSLDFMSEEFLADLKTKAKTWKVKTNILILFWKCKLIAFLNHFLTKKGRPQFSSVTSTKLLLKSYGTSRELIQKSFTWIGRFRIFCWKCYSRVIWCSPSMAQMSNNSTSPRSRYITEGIIF